MTSCSMVLYSANIDAWLYYCVGVDEFCFYNQYDALRIDFLVFYTGSSVSFSLFFFSETSSLFASFICYW